MPLKSNLLRSAGIRTQPNRTTKFQLLKRKAQQQKKPSFLTGLGKTLSLTAAGMKDPANVPKIINDMKRRRMEAKLNQARIAKLRGQPDPLEAMRQSKSKIWAKYLQGEELTQAEQEMIGIAPTEHKITGADVSAIPRSWADYWPWVNSPREKAQMKKMEQMGLKSKKTSTKKTKKETIKRPSYVPKEAWDKTTKQQRIDFLKGEGLW